MVSLSSLGVAKAAAGLVAAMTLAAGGSIAAAASGSPNPADWGRTVTSAVASCKDKLGDGQHGIGQCVSAVAREHGAAQRAAHSSAHPGTPASPAARAHESRPSPSPSAEPGGKRNGAHGQGQPGSVPSGPPSGVPGGPPSDTPAASHGNGHTPRPHGSPAAQP